ASSSNDADDPGNGSGSSSTAAPAPSPGAPSSRPHPETPIRSATIHATHPRVPRRIMSAIRFLMASPGFDGEPLPTRQPSSSVIQPSYQGVPSGSTPPMKSTASKKPSSGGTVNPVNAGEPAIGRKSGAPRLNGSVSSGSIPTRLPQPAVPMNAASSIPSSSSD